MSSNITDVSSIQKLTKIIPSMLGELQLIPGLRPKTENSSGDFTIIALNDNFPSKQCTIRILGNDNRTGRLVVELTTINGADVSVNQMEQNKCYDSIKAFYNPHATREAIIAKIPTRFGISGLREDGRGGYTCQIKTPSFTLELVMHCSGMTPESLHRVPFDFRMLGDSNWDKCTGISNLIENLDLIDASYRNISKPSYVPSKPTPPSVPLPSTPNTSSNWGTPSITPVKVSPSSSTSGPSLRIDPRPSTSSYSSPSSTSSTSSRSTSNINTEDDSIEGMLANLSSDDQNILKNLHMYSFSEFKDKYCTRSPALGDFVAKFEEYGIDVTRDLLTIAGCYN
jgi:hypothetical protein